MSPRAAGGGVLLLPAFLAALGAAGALSCSARLTRFPGSPDPAGFPPAESRLALAPYRQDPERCGPFALAAVLAFFGKPGTAAELEPSLYLPSVRGTLTMDLFLAARRRGLPARQEEGDTGVLRRELAAGRPAIALLRYPAVAGGAGHFVVVTGASASPPGLFLLWGDGGESWSSLEAFDGMWERSGRWMLSFDGGLPSAGEPR